MDITEFKLVLTSFADVPSDVDMRRGKVVAQIRDELIEVDISYTQSNEHQLLITENEQQYPARGWLLNRIARLPQLADRLITYTTITPDQNTRSPFVVPSGRMTPDLSVATDTLEDSPVSDSVESIMEYANKPLPGATSVLYITSDAGEGKTTIINRATNLQAIHYKEKNATSLIVPIALGGKAFLNFDDAVIAMLVNKLRFNYLYFDAFIQLVRMGAIVPAFDGYEEMLVEGSKGEAISALGNIVQALDSRGTIFIAARRAFFDYLSFKTQARLMDAIGDRSASFSRLALDRWNKEQFCKYGHLRQVKDPESIYETVSARLGVDHPLLTRAVLVKRLFDVTGERVDQAELSAMLGSNPHDYFFTFVDAIVKREASEKWLEKVTGDIKVPLLEIEEHHELLANIAQEMWLSSTNSLRYDILDVIVELFADGRQKKATVVRQIKERIKQHSLLSSEMSKGLAIAFDHEDFQNFYLGECLGRLLARQVRSDLQTFLSANLLSVAAVEQSIQHLNRNKAKMDAVATTLMAINSSETGFSFCKENCGALAIRVAECISVEAPLVLRSMFFPVDALAGKHLKNVVFDQCNFQPTSTSMSSLANIRFINCEFERIELNFDNNEVFENSVFSDCKIESMVSQDDDYSFDPTQIVAWLMSAGAQVSDSTYLVVNHPIAKDERLKILERFLRVFLRSTQVDEDIIRLRLGNAAAPRFFSEVLPALLERGVLEDVPWKGKGSQRRYKLMRQMLEVSDALERAQGSFDGFLLQLQT
jgi:hypothetical protein